MRVRFVSIGTSTPGQSDEAGRPQAEAEAEAEVVTLVLQFCQPQLSLEPTERSDRVLLAASHGQLELRSPAPSSGASGAATSASSPEQRLTLTLQAMQAHHVRTDAAPAGAHDGPADLWLQAERDDSSSSPPPLRARDPRRITCVHEPCTVRLSRLRYRTHSELEIAVPAMAASLKSHEFHCVLLCIQVLGPGYLSSRGGLPQVKWRLLGYLHHHVSGGCHLRAS